MKGRSIKVRISNSSRSKNNTRIDNVGCPAPEDQRRETGTMIPCAEQEFFKAYPWLKLCDNVRLTQPSLKEVAFPPRTKRPRDFTSGPTSMAS